MKAPEVIWMSSDKQRRIVRNGYITSKNQKGDGLIVETREYGDVDAMGTPRWTRGNLEGWYVQELLDETVNTVRLNLADDLIERLRIAKR